MSFIRKYHDDFLNKNPRANLVVTFYNALDLLASPSNNFENINKRLDQTFSQVITRMLNHRIIKHEPFFEILQELFPNRDIEYSNELDIRADGALGLFSFLINIKENGSNINVEDKSIIIEFATNSRTQKNGQIIKTTAIRNEIISKIIEQNLDAKDYHNWKPYVESFLKKMIQDYANDPRFLLEPFLPSVSEIDITSCELFLNAFSYYLMDNSKSPDINDNIDALSLLYVRNGRKLLIHDEMWENCINMVGLKEKYLEPIDIYKTKT